MLYFAEYAQADEHLRTDHGVLHVFRELLPEIHLHVGTPHSAERDRTDDRKRERGPRAHVEDMCELAVPLDLEQDLVTELEIALRRPRAFTSCIFETTFG